jgi:hypothetical protein
VAHERRILSVEEILGAEVAEEELTDPSAAYVVLTPRALSLLSLMECRDQLERRGENSLLLGLAAKSAHLAMHAALVDALAGSAGIGAFPPNLRKKWLTYFNARDDETAAPADDWVMSFNDLLNRATTHPLEWTGQPLNVTQSDLAALKRLTYIRHRVEHPRPISHLIAPELITETLPIAARLTLKILDTARHQLEPIERQIAEAAVTAISQHCS